MAKLIGKRGLLPDTRLSLEEGEEWTIGRDPEEAGLVIEDPSVSRQAALIRKTPQGFLIENLSETNPILVNNQEVEDPQLLAEDDEVKIGDTYFAFTTSEEEPYDTLFEVPPPEEMELKPTGRWLIKVVAGPNTGAEFALQTDRSYLIGTDAASCDIVFHDLSISRQHARLTVDKDETLTVEDLHSRNGVNVDGTLIEATTPLQGNALIATGTTSFVVIDREGAQETVFATPTPEEAAPPPLPIEEEAAEKPKEKPVLSGGAFILLLVTVAIIVVAVAGTLSLFKTDDVVVEHRDFNKEIQQALTEFADVRYQFNRASGKLFLLGHVSTPVEKSEMLYNLENLKFIALVDDNVVVDQYVWDEYNELISHNPDWKGVSIYSPAPGRFVISGYLETQAEGASLNDYLRLNFPYLDKLESQVVVEELLEKDVISKLRTAGLPSVLVEVSNGEVTLSGYINKEEGPKLTEAVDEIKPLHGVRQIRNFVVLLAEDGSVIDVTGDFQVEGFSKTDGKTVNVLIDGEIVSRGDLFQGMQVVGITSNTIILEKNGVKYKIRYNQ